MQKIRQILRANGFDVTTLTPLYTERDRIGCIEIDGSSAMEAWKVLHRQANDSGFCPVILGDADALERHRECREAGGDLTTDGIVEASLSLSPETFLAERAAMNELENGALADADWPADVEPSNQIISTHDLLTQKPLPVVYLAMVPTPASWEIPAYLYFGNWNECPEPHEHVAVWRRWNRTYGAEIAAITGDVIEAVVTRPPATRPDAMKLAREQMIYCDDIVSQGTETLPNLAAALLNGQTWYFWWD